MCATGPLRATPSRARRLAPGFFAAILLAATPMPGVAESEAILIELNKLQDDDSACQAFVLLQNKTAYAFDSLALDLVLFDQSSVIARRLAVDMAPLRPGKTTVKVFAIDGLGCDAIQRVLLNDVVGCAVDDAAPDCLGMIRTTSRAAAAFVK